MRVPRLLCRTLSSKGLLSGLLLPLVLAGCAGYRSNPNPPPTASISANPASIAVGGSSTLTVAATNATQVKVTGNDGSTYALPPSGGTQVVSPAATTIYTVLATGTGGQVSFDATVTVVPNPPPPIVNPPPTVTITANPASITADNSSILTVTATNATNLTITGSDGSKYPPLPPNGGTLPISPLATTTYKATAVGLGGTASAAVQVIVTPNPPPSVTITANPTSITAGSSSILTVQALNATGVMVKGNDNKTYNLPASGGPLAVSPLTTTIYTATATGPGGSSAPVTTTVTVTPNPSPTITMTASPASITVGGSSTLTVAAVNATQVTISGGNSACSSLKSNGGICAVTPTGTTNYLATATGPGGTATTTTTVTVTAVPAPTVTIAANPATIASGNSSTLTVAATNATRVTLTNPDGTTYNFPQASGGIYAVSPTANAVYKVTATGTGGSDSAIASVTVTQPGTVVNVDHVIFMLQENHSFDEYFGMLNPYRQKNAFTTGDDGNTYNVDGIDDKLTTISNQDDAGDVYNLFKFKSSCIDDESSDWLASFGDVNRYDFTTARGINMDGFVHNAEGYAKDCASSGFCSGSFTDLTGKRAMGYYDSDFLNYYYYMASQFALSDRWFSPVASKSIANRIATFTGGTTQGLVKDPGNDDKLPQLDINNIFSELDQADVSWKIYYTVTQALCLNTDDCTGSNPYYPATDFSNLSYSYRYLYENPADATTGVRAPCTAPTVASNVVGDTTNSFCIDPTHIAKLDDPANGYFADLKNGTLPSFAFIEAGYGNNDEHPGSGQSILSGQTQVANIIDQFMTSSSWKDSVFFLSYDEGGGPYDHVPPVPGQSNLNTNTTALGAVPPDISSIAVNPDTYNPCVAPAGTTPNLHCDLASTDPGANPADAAAVNGFAAQLGFRVPNMVISPFTRKHYVSHIPMDHTAVIKFVEDRFIGPNAHLTPRDAAQPDLLDFFDFTKTPWATPPTPPAPDGSIDATCTPTDMGP